MAAARPRRRRSRPARPGRRAHLRRPGAAHYGQPAGRALRPGGAAAVGHGRDVPADEHLPCRPLAEAAGSRPRPRTPRRTAMTTTHTTGTREEWLAPPPRLPEG